MDTEITRSDGGHCQDDLTAVAVMVAPTAGLVVARGPLGTAVIVVVVVVANDLGLGEVLGPDELLLPPPPLSPVLHVLPPLLLGPELAYLDLGGRVLVLRGQLARPLRRYLPLALAEEEGTGWSPGNVAAAVWPDLQYNQLSPLSPRLSALRAVTMIHAADSFS